MTTVLQGGIAFIQLRMEVMSMVYFTFQDLMIFGMFMLALLTFIFRTKSNLLIEKPPL